MPKLFRSYVTLNLHTPTFTCFVDGSWKDDELTSKVDWVLELQDGTMDLVGIQGSRQSLSLIYTEMHGLLWAMT